MNHVIVLAGPTAVGKTSASIKLADHYKIPVISADSRQVYKQMSIGTAKPRPSEMGEVKHYMIDNKSIDEKFNAYQFESEALSILSNEIWPAYNKAIVTGGSGLYIDALCYGIDYMPDIPDKIREKWGKIYARQGITHLQRELETNDPQYFQEVDQANPKRLLRALEVIDVSGKPYSHFRRKHSNPRDFNIIKIALKLPRETLYQRIEQRMDQMIAEGLFAEAEQLYPFRQNQALQTVGYQEIFGYLDGKYDREEAIRLLKRNSRRYAKRQMTWFKKDDSYQWFAPDQMNSMIDYIDQNLK